MAALRKKLIEVALPLAEINDGTKPETENPFLKGHPRAIHNWWARTPLSMCRAVLFAQLVDDPGGGLDSAKADQARKPLLDLVRRLGTWDATSRADTIDEARDIILRQFAGKPPAVWDMFSGRGSISMEAQRLGLRVYSSDLNPVAVTIQQALLNYPQRLANCTPVNPGVANSLASASWRSTSAAGLAEDVREYGNWVCGEAVRKLRHLYPTAPVTDGTDATVIAWLWARTVASPNPAANGVHVPLVRSFVLSSKKRNEAIIVPVLDGSGYRFTVKTGGIGRDEIATARAGTTSGRRGNFTCLLSGAPIPSGHVKAEGMAGRMGARLMAVVAQGKRGRVYVEPTEEMERVARKATPTWKPSGSVPERLTGGTCYGYGLTCWGDLFTKRQLVALTTLSDLIGEARKRIKHDYVSMRATFPGDDVPLADGGNGAQAYADAVATYLACALSRMTDYHCSLATWNPTNQNVGHLFQRQAIPMTWDFAEANPIDGKLDFSIAAGWIADSLKSIPFDQDAANVFQFDARLNNPPVSSTLVVSTDPPYYDNIGYADLSDFFYVWLRRTLRNVHPGIFRTVLTPKAAELIASPHRHRNSSDAAKIHFRDGMSSVFGNLYNTLDPSIPMTVYYAFKQQEMEVDERGDDGVASTGWETMLEGLLSAGFAVTGTWPVRTTKKARSVARNNNALASAIVIVCRKREQSAPVVTFREFKRTLRRVLPDAIGTLRRMSVAPVDLRQAAIGPGMATFSQYAQVLEADGTPVLVRQALAEINRALDESHRDAAEDMDPETRFCISWFEQYGMDDGPFGEAAVLFTATNTSYDGLCEAGVLVGGGGKVRLKPREELNLDWNPETGDRVADWECVQHLTRAMMAEAGGGVTEAARLATAMGSGRAATSRALAYRLHAVSERRGWSAEALAYNVLAMSWRQIQEEMARASGQQTEIALQEE